MADKSFIDSTVRLRNIYQETSKNSYPIEIDAYPTVKPSQIANGQVVYDQGVYCSFFGTSDEAKFKAVKRMNKYWQSVAQRRIGANKSVNPKRILVLFTNNDYECVYPAQEFKVKNWRTQQDKFFLADKLNKAKNPNKIFIERNVGYIFYPDDTMKYTNYWMPLKDERGNEIGIIGMQFAMNDYEKLIPTPVIEENYPVSYIGLYDKNLNQIWKFGCTEEDCNQNINKASKLIEKQMVDTRGNYVQWSEPREFNLSDEDTIEIAEEKGKDDQIMKAQN